MTESSEQALSSRPLIRPGDVIALTRCLVRDEQSAITRMSVFETRWLVVSTAAQPWSCSESQVCMSLIRVGGHRVQTVFASLVSITITGSIEERNQ